MKSPFAKVFDSTRCGQLVVMLKRNCIEAKPEIRIFAQPEDPPELGVCELALGFPDTDEGWDAAEKAFSRIDATEAENLAKPIFNFASQGV